MLSQGCLALQAVLDKQVCFWDICNLKHALELCTSFINRLIYWPKLFWPKEETHLLVVAQLKGEPVLQAVEAARLQLLKQLRWWLNVL